MPATGAPPLESRPVIEIPEGGLKVAFRFCACVGTRNPPPTPPKVGATPSGQFLSGEGSGVGLLPTGSWKEALLLAAGGVAAFHLAYAFPPLCFLIAVYPYCLFRLADLPTTRKAFYFGLTVGYAVYAPHLTFFWTIFGWPAVALWAVLAFWLGLFVALARLCRRRFGRLAVVLVPFLWTGLEYFRSELYYLRFSWLDIGYAFSNSPQVFRATHLGMYGVALALMLLVALPSLLTKMRGALLLGIFLVVLGCAVHLPVEPAAGRRLNAVQVVGLQMEFPFEAGLIGALDRLASSHPASELVVLSEYTLQDPPSEPIRAWCRKTRRYLAVGGKDFLSDSKFHNTVFVVDPKGEIIFRQAKSVPVQFFEDGLPAQEQNLWDSPWGRIGFCICYDLSYRRVTDRLAALGAQAIIVPTADEISWGEGEHRLHTRVAPVRAAEYALPIFRVASSGISQWVDARGHVRATAPFPGQGETITAQLELDAPGRLPLDHWLGPLSVLVTSAIILWLSAKTLLGKFSRL